MKEEKLLITNTNVIVKVISDFELDNQNINVIYTKCICTNAYFN